MSAAILCIDQENFAGDFIFVNFAIFTNSRNAIFTNSRNEIAPGWCRTFDVSRKGQEIKAILHISIYM